MPNVKSDRRVAAAIAGTAETVFFDKVGGRLRQRVITSVEAESPIAADVRIGVGAQAVTTRLELVPGRREYPCHAAVRWPRPASTAPVRLAIGGRVVSSSTVTVGTHRPWTIYVLSDLCADDTWAYDDLAKHDGDDVATTVAELAAGPDNAYNFASVYQVERFTRTSSPACKAALGRALRCGRLYATPVPDQLLCGGFVLAAYPLILEPYRRLVLPHVKGNTAAGVCAYHMEATTWSNGTVQLMADAGFSVFGKSLLRYQAGWLDTLQKLPRLSRLEVAPGRFVYLVLRCNDYVEAMPMLEGVARTMKLIHDEVIPAHESLGAAYPSTLIPLIGMYGDLAPSSPEKVALKVAAIEQYNNQGWEFPKVVNASWCQFGAALVKQLGRPAQPRVKGLAAAHGDTGSSWEAWPMSVQAEFAAWRKAQREVVALRTVAALLNRAAPDTVRRLALAADEVVYLGDHAWNGSSDGSRALNLSVRRRRLGAIREHVAAVRSALLPNGLRDGARVAVVNTLAWDREVRVVMPESAQRMMFVDGQRGERFRAVGGIVRVPDVPGLGARILEVVRATPGRTKSESDPPTPAGTPLAALSMRPLLYLDGKEVAVDGGWKAGGSGAWHAGPFSVTVVRDAGSSDAGELVVDVAGAPPAEPYELRFVFTLPWPQAVWRGESGGGFVTPGAVSAGGDSLLGIVGSVFACGEGLSACSPDNRERLDFAFEQTGLAGLGGRSTARAAGTYGERAQPDVMVVQDSVLTPPDLQWYLLGQSQNYREAFVDQGGCRAWRFRACIRKEAGGFDDAGLYRFASGANTLAELVEPGMLLSSGSALTMKGGSGLLVLAIARHGKSLEIDIYNTGARARAPTLAGPLVDGRRCRQADMLGRAKRGAGIEVAGRSFAKAIVG